MTFINILLFSILTAFTSCNRQTQKTSENKIQPAITIGDTVSKMGNNIRCIFQDNNNNLWFASDGEGLFKYDGKTIMHFTDKNGLCGNNIRLIRQAKDSTLLIETANGVCSFDGNQFRILQANKSNPTTTGFSNAVLLSGSYYQGDSLYNFQIPQTSRLTKTYSQTPYAIYCSYKDSKGNIWFGTESRGVCKYDGKSFSWFDGEESGLAVRTIFEDKTGTIWIGNNGYGLFRYNGKTLENFTKEHKLDNPDFRTSLKGKEGTLARVWTISDDKKGNLWIGTIDAGLWRYDGKTLTNYTTKEGLSSNSISTVFCDNKGNLWIGADNGIIVYDGKTFTAFGGQKQSSR